MEGQGEGGKEGRIKVLTSFSPWGVNPFWKCDICHNRILSAGKPWATHVDRKRFVHSKC